MSILFFSTVTRGEQSRGELKRSLSDPRIRCAFVFGSFAKGKEKASSDIDLIVIGDIGMRGVSKLLSGGQEKVGREINPHVFTEEEFKKELRIRITLF